MSTPPRPPAPAPGAPDRAQASAPGRYPRAPGTRLTLHAITAGHDPHQPVLRDLDLTITPGTTTGIAGPSGAGKSTLARVIALLHSPTSGTVTIDDAPAHRTGYRATPAQRRTVALVDQSPRQACDPRWSLRRTLTTPAALAAPRAHRDTAAAQALDWARALGLPEDLLQRRPREVSDGQLQRVCLARALALRPTYLVCDEITASLDAVTAATVLDVLAGLTTRGLGVLTISHDRDLLHAWADTVHTLTAGRLR